LWWDPVDSVFREYLENIREIDYVIGFINHSEWISSLHIHRTLYFSFFQNLLAILRENKECRYRKYSNIENDLENIELPGIYQIFETLHGIELSDDNEEIWTVRSSVYVRDKGTHNNALQYMRIERIHFQFDMHVKSFFNTKFFVFFLFFQQNY